MFMKTADIEEMKQQVEVKPETVFFYAIKFYKHKTDHHQKPGSAAGKPGGEK